MMGPTDPTNESKPSDEDESGPYRLADESPAPPRAASTSRPVEPKPDLSDSEDRDPVDEVAEEEEEGTDSLPPPISRSGSTQPWLVIAGVCASLLFLSWLAGAPQLSLPDADGNIRELGFGERLNGLARTAVFLPLAMLAAVFGLGALAFVRQRPIGMIGPLFAKSLAIVCLATLVWLVPSDIRFLKQALYVIGIPVIAAALAVPIFRLHPRDAVFATASSLIGMILLVLAAWVVVWATTGPVEHSREPV
ncbi:MAG: hypothetical protein RLY21_1095, partial [Planctomycetota bacterium]